MTFITNIIGVSGKKFTFALDMKPLKICLISSFFLFNISVFGQWRKNTYDDGFALKIKDANCFSKDENGSIRLYTLVLRKSKVDSFKNVRFEFWALNKGEKFCENMPTVDFSFEMDTGRFLLFDNPCARADVLMDNLSEDDKKGLQNHLILSPNFTIWEKGRLKGAFSKCKSLRVRINDGVCGTETYYFDMTGSSSALNWVNSK